MSENRELHVRAKVDEQERAVYGLAVPWNETISVWGQRERFAPGSVEAEGAKLFYRHSEPIGRIVVGADSDAGWEIKGVPSSTPRADEAYTLAREGVLDGLSVGFEPIEWHIEREDENDVIVYDRVRVREVSLVPFPAYPSATVTEVRAAASQKENPMPEPKEREEDLTEVREDLDLVKRSLTVLLERGTADESPVSDTRSAGEFVRALAAGDAETIAAYNRAMEQQFSETQHRAYTGGTSADAPIKDGWVGDLTKLFDASSGVLSNVFSTGTLPEKGMNIEYAELLANTVQVTEQAAEGDDLAYGKVTLTTKTAPVKTYGGYTQLTRQAIQRSTLPLLNRSLEALAIAAGARKKAVLRSAFGTVVAARTALAANAGVVLLGATLGAGVAGNWEDALIDAALKYDGQDSSIEALIVSATVFKKMRSLTVAGERVFTVYDKNHSGSLDLPGLTGNLASVPVFLDAGQAGDSAVFVNGRAIRQYDSALVSLQDENIINLSKDFSVYRYGAVAAEVPQLVVPVKLAAA